VKWGTKHSLNISMKNLTFCISSFQSSWHFAFYVPWRTKHNLKLLRLRSYLS
jgi:hypothetical protein